MTLREKVGQMIMAGVPDSYISEETKKKLTKLKIGNYILFERNVKTKEQVKQLCSEIDQCTRNATGEIALIAVDQEGGVVTRFPKEIPNTPSAMAVAATGDPDAAYECGRLTAIACRSMGINFDLAPVLDINCNPKNPVIGVRSYGDTAEWVCEYGIPMIQGLQKEGVLASAKHFPGHGDTDVDSHLGLPVVHKTWEELKQFEVMPFQKAIYAGVACITTAHILFPEIEPENKPATMSKRILTDYLRGEMKFDGMILTDCMEMAAIQKYYGTAKGAVEAVKAGATMICISHSLDLAEEAILRIEEAVENGEISLQTIDAAVNKILSYKKVIRNMNPTESIEEDMREKIGRIRENGIVKLSEEVLPKITSDTLFLGSFAYRATMASGNVDKNVNFAQYLAERFHADYIISEVNPKEEEIQQYVRMAKKHSVIVYGMYNGHLNRGQISLANALIEAGHILVAVTLRNPYDVMEINGKCHKIAAFEYSEASFDAVIRVLEGTIHCAGKMPVRMEKRKLIPYLIGMDGGGTKTSVVIADVNGNELDAFTADSINYNGLPKEQVDSTLESVFYKISELGYEKKLCRAICIGSAGISNEKVKEYFNESLIKSGYSGTLKLVGDHEIALKGAIRGDSGIILIAGTGSICYGMTEDGNSYRSGGYGYLIDDCGGGYDLGREILKQVVRMEDGRGEETVLQKLVFEQWKVSNIRELISLLYSETMKKQDIAGLAPLLTIAMEQKDPVAEKIILRAGKELADLVTAVQVKMNQSEVTIATAGSVLKNNRYIRDSFLQEIKKRYEKDTVVMPAAEPVYGAVRMAVQSNCSQDNHIN